LAREGYVAIEMECATLFGLGTLRKVKTASVLMVNDNAVRAEPLVHAEALRGFAARAGEMVFASLSRFGA
jgi:5'-methylthioadenosine phosphorylase